MLQSYTVQAPCLTISWHFRGTEETSIGFHSNYHMQDFHLWQEHGDPAFYQHHGSNYCHWVAIRFIGLDTSTKSGIMLWKQRAVKAWKTWTEDSEHVKNGLMISLFFLKEIYLFFRITTKCHWVFHLVHSPMHNGSACQSLSQTCYTHYYCHLVPRAFLASSTGAGNSPSTPSQLINEWTVM